MKLKKFDAAESLDDEETIAYYLQAAMEERDGGGFQEALQTVARARGITQVARDSGLSRATLYKALGENGNPQLDTVRKVLATLGMKLTVTPDKP